MSSGIEQMIQKLKNIEKTLTEIEKEVPRKAFKKIEAKLPKITENAMNQFYLAYTPDIYKRTFGLYKGVANGVTSTINGNRMTITISSDGVPDHAHDSGEYIFLGAFERGIHGETSICVSTPPWMLMGDDIEESYQKFAKAEIDKMIAKII